MAFLIASFAIKKENLPRALPVSIIPDVSHSSLKDLYIGHWTVLQAEK